MAPTSLTVSDDEVCATTPTADMSPHESSYEGYMGNYGNTLDRWYRRAAIVLWPRRWAFAVRAEASPGWALDRLADLVRLNDLAGARESAATMASFWRIAMGGERLLDKALIVARDLDEPGIAAMLLAPFQIEMLAPHPCGAACPARGTLRRVLGAQSGRGLVRPRPTHALIEAPGARGLARVAACAVRGAAGGATGRRADGSVVVGQFLDPAARVCAACFFAFTTPSYRYQALVELGPSVAGMLVSTLSVKVELDTP